MSTIIMIKIDIIRNDCEVLMRSYNIQQLLDVGIFIMFSHFSSK